MLSKLRILPSTLSHKSQQIEVSTRHATSWPRVLEFSNQYAENSLLTFATGVLLTPVGMR